MGGKTATFIVASLVGLICLMAQVGYAQGPSAVQSPNAPRNAAEEAAMAAAIAAYWTPERMAEAAPYPMPRKYVDPAQAAAAGASMPPGPPGARPGYNPRDPASSKTSIPVLFDRSVDTAGARSAAASAENGGVAPASAAYPSAHSTVQFQGRYRTWPRSPIGKVFFTQNGGNFVCSASLIGYRHVVTAGHCLVDGANHWSTNVQFCPSYDSSQGGVNPAVGCWTTNNVWSATRWSSYGEADADIGMAIYGDSGTVIADYPGDAVGYLGYSWNWGIGQVERMFGYPSADRAASAHNEYADFNGGKLFETAAEEAGYTVNWGTFDDSKFIGTTQTPGMSGGPWIFRMGMKYYNTWNSNWVNGVNSHLRCWDTGCTDLYAEVSSPQFLAYGNECSCSPCGVVDIMECVFNSYPR
jgi:hypothetical protein